jgi:hypothetical protein
MRLGMGMGINDYDNDNDYDEIIGEIMGDEIKIINFLVFTWPFCHSVIFENKRSFSFFLRQKSPTVGVTLFMLA